MADFTKKAIKNSLIKLLNEKPLKQISVRDIVDDCGVNRNTFYYHFQDIPQLLQSIIQEDADRLVLENPQIGSVEDCMNAVIDFSLKNKKAVLHIYKSVNRDIYEQYQWQVCEHIVTVYLDQTLKGRQIAEADRAFLIEYLKCILFGLVMDWLETGMRDDIQQFVHRLCRLNLGNLEDMIQRCQEDT